MASPEMRDPVTAVPALVLTAVVSIMIPLFCGVVVLISQPFEGAMTRLRAHHTPKGMSLDGSYDTRVNHQLGGPFSTLSRTYKLEGWRGIYKGAYAYLIALSVYVVPAFAGGAWAAATALSSTPADPGSASTPMATSASTHIAPRMLKRTFQLRTADESVTVDLATTNLLVMPLCVVMSFLVIPMIVIMNRAIVTPYRLPYSIRGSLRILLSRRERQRPYVMYTPLLLISTALIVVTPLATTLLLSAVSSFSSSARTGIAMGVNALTVLWVVPLKVVMVKASVQPNLLPATEEEEQVLLMTENEAAVEEDTAGVSRSSTTDEDVVNIRPALPKYTTLVGTVRTIVQEEGWQTLYRGWVWTTLVLLISGYAVVLPPAH